MTTQSELRSVRTSDAPQDRATGRVGGWMLALSPLGFVAVVASMAAIFASTIGGTTFADLTRAQMDALGAGWIAARLIVAAATLIVTVGAGLVAWVLRATDTPGRLLAWATVMLAVLNALVAPLDVWNGVVAQSFTTPTLGESGAWELSLATLPWTFGAVVLEVTLLAAAMWASGIRRTAGLVIGVVGIIVLIVIAFAADSVPPFVPALLACPLGIAWLRRPHEPRSSLS